MLERGTFRFYSLRSNPVLTSYFRLCSTTGLEAERALSVVHSVNTSRKINRPRRFLHRSHKYSPPARIPFTLSASAIIGATQLPLFLRFGCPRIPASRTASSSVHPRAVRTMTHHSKQAPSRILVEMQELVIRSAELHPLNLF